VATNCWDGLINAQSASKFDSVEAKAMTAVVALRAEAVSGAGGRAALRASLRDHQRSISKLPDARKVAYEPVRRETRSPEPTDLVLPSAKLVSGVERRWTTHLLAAEDGTFLCALKGWEPEATSETDAVSGRRRTLRETPVPTRYGKTDVGLPACP
jgi:hypothetical protein